MRRDAWLTLHWEVACTIAPAAHLSTVRTDSWSTVQDRINIQVCDSDIGSALFGFTIGALLSQKIKEVCNKHLDKKNMEWASAVAADTCDVIVTECEELSNIDMLPHRRWVEARYAGATVKAQVTSLENEVEWRVQAAWKAVAVVAGVIKRLPLGDFSKTILEVYKTNF